MARYAHGAGALGAPVTPFADIRAQIPAAQRLVYLETAATSPIPDYVRQAVHDAMERRAWSGEGFFDDALERTDAVRQSIALHLGVESSGIAFMKNTGEGINHIARSLPIKRGQNVVITDLEFPSNRLPWQALEAQGVELRIAKSGDNGMGPRPEDFAAVIDNNTAIVASSWVTYQTGYRIDVDAVGKIAHAHGAKMLVDAIQGLGAMVPPKMDHIDFLACGSHKWLMAPFGIGFLYVRPELVASLEPDHLGWWNLEDYTDFETKYPNLAPTARRFEIGNLAFEIIEGLGAAFAHFPDMSAAEAHIHKLTDRLIEGIGPAGGIGTPLDHNRRAGIIRFETGDAEAVHARLREMDVYASLRTGAVRFAPHFWNTLEEMDRTVDAVRSVLKA